MPTSPRSSGKHRAPTLRLNPSLQVRVSMLTSALGMAAALLQFGVEPVTTIAAVLATTLGAAEVSCRLTHPARAPRVRVTVIVIVTTVVTSLVYEGFPPLVCVVVALGASLGAAEVARRLADPVQSHLVTQAA